MLNTLDIEVVLKKVKENLQEIVVLTENFITYYFEQLGEGSVKELNRLGTRVRHAYKTLDIILRCSLIEKERAKSRVDLNVLVRDVIRFLEVPSHIEVRIKKSLPTVRADKVRMYQLFLNLLSNAVESIDKPHGVIVVTPKLRQRRCWISIEDNGRGIGLRYQRNLFKLFHVTPESRKAGRTGVGLVIVKKIIEEGRGKVTLISKKGSGTNVAFDIPY